MSDISNDDLDSIRALLNNGTSESYDLMVQGRSAVIAQVQRVVERIQRVAPGVALSPHMLRALRTLEMSRVADDDVTNTVPAAA